MLEHSRMVSGSNCCGPHPIEIDAVAPNDNHNVGVTVYNSEATAPNIAVVFGATYLILLLYMPITLLYLYNYLII